MNLVNTLYEQLKPYLLKVDAQLVVAYSGGVDSHVLLHVLAQLRVQHSFRLSAIHIHHGLSDNGDHWLAHCEAICEQLSLPLQSAKLGLQKQPGQSLEAQAREARYAKLQGLAPDNSLVLLGQHQDDQLETVLLQLKRGAGPKGLAAMTRQWQVHTDRANQESKTVAYFRPLLNVTQSQLLDYARQHQLQWQEDESNQNTDFERNFLRQDVLPTLTKRWPEFAKAASRSAALCAEQQGLLDEISEQKLLDLRGANNSLSIEKLSQLSDSWQRQVVRLWLAQQHIPSPSQAVLGQLKAECFAASEDANPIIQWQHWQFRRFDRQLYVQPVCEELAGMYIAWQGEEQLELPQGLGCVNFSDQPISVQDQARPNCVLDTALGPVSLRFGGYGDKFKPLGERHSKPLKQWFKQWKVPPWQRDKIAIVIQNEQVQALLIDKQWCLNNSPVINQSPLGSGAGQSLTKANLPSTHLFMTILP